MSVPVVSHASPIQNKTTWRSESDPALLSENTPTV